MAGQSKESRLEKLLDQARDLYFEGEFGKAEKKLTSAIATAQEIGEPAALAEAWNVLAGIRRAQERYDDALELARRALETAENDADATDQQTAMLTDNVGQILCKLDRPEEGLACFEKVMSLLSRQNEPEHAMAACTCMEMAAVHQSLGQNDEMERHTRLAYDHARQGNLHELDIDIANDLTDILLETDRVAEAQDILETLHKHYTDALAEPDDSFALLDPESAVFEMIKREHRTAGSLPLCMHILLVQMTRVRHRLGQPVTIPGSLPPLSQFERDVYAESPVELAEKLLKLGLQLHILGKEAGERGIYDAAETHYRSILDLLKEAGAADNLLYQATAGQLRQLYADTGRDPRQAGV